MARTEGFFWPADSSTAGSALGLIRASIAFPAWTKKTLDLLFVVDTGSSFTVLVDAAFLRAIHALGYPERRRTTSDAMRWVFSQPRVFERVEDPVWTLGGSLEDVFLIKGSSLYVNAEQGRLRKRPVVRGLGPVCGVFSPPFLDAEMEKPPKLLSVLGRDKLNVIEQLGWSWPTRLLRLDL